MAALQGDALDLAPDSVLQAVAAEASETTGATWSAITLLLRQSVIFRAHFNLPRELVSLCSTDRSGWYCQDVVRVGRPVVVGDVEHDPSPHLESSRRLGVRSYAGVPLWIDDVVVGALCVHDEQARSFDEAQMTRIAELARYASARLVVLARRRAPHRRLLDLAMRPAFAEIRNELTPIQTDLDVAQERLRQLLADGADTPAEAQRSLDAMVLALTGLQRAARRLTENLSSLQTLCCGEDRAVVSEVVQVSDELAYHHTQLVGGVRWTVSAPKTALDVSQRTSVSVLTASLSMLALRLGDIKDRSGIAVSVGEGKGQVLFRISANLDPIMLHQCAKALADLVDNTQVHVTSANDAFQIALPAA
jgi:GAF domain-containing protein